MPSSRPTASATWWASPVIIATSTPSPLQVGRRPRGPRGGPRPRARRRRRRRRRGRGRARPRRARCQPSIGVAAGRSGTSSAALAQQGRPADGVAGRRRWSASTPRPVSARKSSRRGGPRRARRRRRRSPGPAGARCRPRRRRPGAAPRRRRGRRLGGHAGDDVGALGQGAGLVEQHGVDRAHPLQGEAVLDQDPGLAPTRRSTAR